MSKDPIVEPTKQAEGPTKEAANDTEVQSDGKTGQLEDKAQTQAGTPEDSVKP